MRPQLLRRLLSLPRFLQPPGRHKSLRTQAREGAQSRVSACHSCPRPASLSCLQTACLCAQGAFPTQKGAVPLAVSPRHPCFVASLSPFLSLSEAFWKKVFSPVPSVFSAAFVFLDLGDMKEHPFLFCFAWLSKTQLHRFASAVLHDTPYRPKQPVPQSSPSVLQAPFHYLVQLENAFVAS